VRNTFDGTYFKHQKGGRTVALIAGTSAGNHAFIQIITNEFSHCLNYPAPDHTPGDIIRVGGSIFSLNGVSLDIEGKDISVRGEIGYAGQTPLRYDVMGPFRYLPMQCRHRIHSLHHRLCGSLAICGEYIDFTGGTGYIEGDSGISFPRSYMWVQCNDFPEKACIMASVADIPLAGLRFRGCVCVVWLGGVEYRLATYLGVKILHCDENRVVLKQGSLCLEINIAGGTGHALAAPVQGEMAGEINERIVCGAQFRFMKGGKVLFEQHSENASFEYVG